MHPNPAFRTTPETENLAFARSRGFGTLALNASAGPLLSHIPFRVCDDERVEFHLVRSNPIVRLLQDPQPAVLSISGPHSYVSPDWYGVGDQVPTWNYVAVHLRGVLELRPAGELVGILERLSAQFEDVLPKPPWTMDKVDGAALERLMRQIVPCRLMISDVQGTWKLGQNKPDSARQGAAEGVETSGIGEGLGELAAMMRDPGP